MEKPGTSILVCKRCGNPIGTVVSRKHAARKLLIFAPASAAVMAEIKGDAAVHCPNCGAVRNWYEDNAPAIVERLQMDDEEQHGY